MSLLSLLKGMVSLLSVMEIAGESYTIDLKINSVVYGISMKQKDSLGFLHTLIKQLIVGEISKEVLDNLSVNELQEITVAFSKANGFSDLYRNPHNGNFLNSFRSSLKSNFIREEANNWQTAVEKWRSTFTGSVDRIVEEYHDSIGKDGLEIAKIMARKGWMLSPDLILTTRITGLKPFDRKKAEKMIIARTDEDWMKDRMEAWNKLKPFYRRRKLINAIFEAYKRNDLEMAIYGLIPQSEGVIWDFLLENNPAESEMEELLRFSKKKFVTIESVMRIIMLKMTGLYTVPFYSWVKFVDYDDEMDLNRHAIEHGIAVDFGTKENFFKLFSYLEFLYYFLSRVKALKPEKTIIEPIENGCITTNTRRIMEELPPGVRLLVAAKNRSVEEIEQAIRAGAEIVGQNYAQQGEKQFNEVKHKAEWHFIGQLQRNKINKIIKNFDVIETVDSFEMGRQIDMRSSRLGRIMPILVEVNSGREPQKAGVYPEKAMELVEKLSQLPNIRVMGLMTMGPVTEDPEDLRPYLRTTRELFDEISAAGIVNVEMRYLSMGMTDSYRVAIEEGANIIRIGRGIFEKK